MSQAGSERRPIPDFPDNDARHCGSDDHRAGDGDAIEAQRPAVTRFAEAKPLTIIAEFIEVETGKGAVALDRRAVSIQIGG